jgi:hypothetical protein
MLAIYRSFVQPSYPHVSRRTSALLSGTIALLLLSLFAACDGPPSRTDRDASTRGWSFPYDALPEGELYLPLEIDVVEGKLVSKRSLGKTEIPPYAELLEINGIPANTIWEQSQKYLSPPLPHAKAEFFRKHVYFYLTTLFDLHSPWTVRYVWGEEQSVTAEGIGIVELYGKLADDPRHAAYSMEVADESIPVLDLPNFAHGSPDDYQEFIAVRDRLW